MSMKKLLAVLLAVLLFAMCGCGAKTEVVEVNEDNWETYFEIRQLESWQYNDFDEPVELWVEKFLCIKDEYAERIDLETIDIIFEVSSKQIERAYEIDLENQTYSIDFSSGGTVVYEGSWTEQLPKEFWKIGDETALMEIHAIQSVATTELIPEIQGMLLDESDRMICLSREDVEITRIKGTMEVAVE